MIQGTCASITKMAVIGLYKKGIIPLMTVHDEIVVKGDYRTEVEEEMKKAWKYFTGNLIEMPLVAFHSNAWEK